METFFSARCPYCFKMLKTNNVVFEKPAAYNEDLFLKTYYAQNGQNSINSNFGYIDPAKKGSKDIIRDIDISRIMSGILDEGGEIHDIKLCPYCHHKLPNTFATSNTRYIAVVGLPSSGKTAYLSALNASLNKMSYFWTDQYLEANRPLNEMTNKYLTDPSATGIATQNIQGPYYYGLRTNEANVKDNIIFFDIPGEYYKDPTKISQQLKKFLLAADGIVFVINAAQSMETQPNEFNDNSVFNDNTKVGRIFAAFQEAGVNSQKKVAILFNKLDKLFTINAEFEGKYMVETQGEEVDESEIKVKSDAIKILLLNNPAVDSSIKQIINRIEVVFGTESRIFASSLIIENESRKVFRYNGAETPFLWLLSQTNAFPKKKID